jgi:uncharacterized protein (DUF1015 family)
MANVFPFHAYRYSSGAGPLNQLVTQPYDKITPVMRTRYLASHPHNLVRVILGEPHPSDSETDNVYTRAAAHFREWIAAGVMVRDAEPALFAYFQEFTDPDTDRRAVRKGFIGTGAVEPYEAGIVHRHERTLSGPKKDRREVLRHTRAHFGQIFMLYPDPAGEVDRLLDEAAAGEPDARVTDEFGAVHSLWRIASPARISRIQALMADKKLLIADGHHRYETALAFRDENPDLEDAGRVMMTFVNMHSKGLTILATHRLVSNMAGFDKDAFLKKAASLFVVERLDSLAGLRSRWERTGQSWIGAAIGEELYGLSAKFSQEVLDVRILHDVLGISEAAVREEKYIRYMRGLEAAAAEARNGGCQIAFLLKPASVQQVADISYAGGVMPQKTTDFYPKLLTGMTIYRLEK